MNMASGTTEVSEQEVPGTTKTKASLFQQMRTKIVHLLRVSLGLLAPQPRRTHTEEHGNTYSFSKRTLDKTVSAITSCSKGRITAVRSAVSMAFSNTDSLEVRLAQTSPQRSTTDCWRMTRLCQDTGSEVCIMALNVAKQVGVTLAHARDELQSPGANKQSMTIMRTAKALVKIKHMTKICGVHSG